jgi:DDE superfamily endonuclease
MRLAWGRRDHWNISGRLAVHVPRWCATTASNITLLPLPPYSPELNPMENIWDYLRGNKLSSLVWDSYQAIVEACKEARDFLIGDPERINSIPRRSWAGSMFSIPVSATNSGMCAYANNTNLQCRNR